MRIKNHEIVGKRYVPTKIRVVCKERVKLPNEAITRDFMFFLLYQELNG